MPLFGISDGRLEPIEQSNFSLEKRLQSLVEASLPEVFSSRLVATEFPTGAQHGGRIDTLALSEENHPVIIEYKKVESSQLINQSLYYLAWMHDHRGDFEIAAQKALGGVEVDWQAVRVICIAPNYKKYDLHAVEVMGANIELWTYRRFANDTLYLEEVRQKAVQAGDQPPSTPATSDLTPGKKAAITRATGSYTFEEHVEGKPTEIRELAYATQEFILAMDPSIDEAPKKFYVAYKISQNIVCLEVQHKRVILYLKLDPKTTGAPPGMSRDLSEVGHYGTGDFGMYLKTSEDLEHAKPFIEAAYRKVGG